MVYLLFAGFLEERAKDSGRPFLRLCEETLIRLVTLPQRKVTYTGGRATRRLKQLQQCAPKPVTGSETETWNAEPPSPNSGNGPPIPCCREGQGLQGLLPTSPLGGLNYKWLFLISFLFKAFLKANVVLKKVVLKKVFSLKRPS